MGGESIQKMGVYGCLKSMVLVMPFNLFDVDCAISE
jgi:hypothetical protein